MADGPEDMLFRTQPERKPKHRNHCRGVSGTQTQGTSIAFWNADHKFQNVAPKRRNRCRGVSKTQSASLRTHFQNAVWTFAELSIQNGRVKSVFPAQKASLDRRPPKIRMQQQNAETAAEGSPKRNPSHSERTFKTQSGDFFVVSKRRNHCRWV